jgi:hypothetical protein
MADFFPNGPPTDFIAEKETVMARAEAEAEVAAHLLSHWAEAEADAARCTNHRAEAAEARKCLRDKKAVGDCPEQPGNRRRRRTWERNHCHPSAIQRTRNPWRRAGICPCIHRRIHKAAVEEDPWVVRSNH